MNFHTINITEPNRAEMRKPRWSTCRVLSRARREHEQEEEDGLQNTEIKFTRHPHRLHLYGNDVSL